MLKNIRLHLHEDEDKQSALDQKLAIHIVETQRKNLNVFRRNIPSIIPLIENTNLKSHSLFSNKFGEINIVDYGQGRVLYGFHPEDEIKQQVGRISTSCIEVDTTRNHSCQNETVTQNDSNDFTHLDSFKIRQHQKPLPKQIECVVMLGCGLGLHIKHLLSKYKINSLILYEPQAEYFQCSALAADWEEIFKLAKVNETAIFLQIEKDGRDLISDIKELSNHFGFSRFHLYKHYNHPVFDSLEMELSKRSWQSVSENGFNIKSDFKYEEYVPYWTKDIDLSKHTGISEEAPLFKKNLKAFKSYFPDIYNQFKDYKTKYWLPILNKQSEVNILKKDNLCSWYGDSPKAECNLNFKSFNSQPHKDGLILGYNGTKLAHYIHYKFVKQTEELLKEAEDEIAELPETVASIIMFGLGSGYQLEKLLNDHTVEKLFICEPNRDFFYASLFAIDWLAIFTKIERSDSRIYLNIGDDGTNLFRDLLNQFHSIGPYILNNTYFYQSYYNSSLNNAIAQLREQLQVVISMGEYFDHAYYGIAHTKECLKRGYPLLSKNPASYLQYEAKEVPVFIIGNGPSIDHSMETIKEWQEKAIIVSCGTALQALFKNGITPDFHAEIEQNRTTFDWPSLIGDLDYLKKISLLSCNGIHPDTCTLYKDVYIAFKEGESSTVSALNVLGESQFESLQHAFPTVSNFTCNLFTVLGFQSIYLLGVDLGFIDVKHHHSKNSAYYNEGGEEAYDYSEKNNTSIVVPGNFRKSVNTKHEFKVSKQMIEQVIGVKSKEQIFYNCSDGAKIYGAIPLKLSDLLLLNDKKQKLNAILAVKTAAYSPSSAKSYEASFEQQFSHSKLIAEIQILMDAFDEKVSTLEDVHKKIIFQKELLFTSYKSGKSLLFYYLYGTINYANALLLKLAVNGRGDTSASDSILACIDLWRVTLSEIHMKLTEQQDYFDNSNFQDHNRQQLMLQNYVKYKSLLIITNSMQFAKCSEWLIENVFNWFTEVRITSYINEVESKKFDFVIKVLIGSQVTLDTNHFGKNNTLLITDEYPDLSENKTSDTADVSFLVKSKSDISHNALSYSSVAIRACIEQTTPCIIFPRLKFDESTYIDGEELLVKYNFPQSIPKSLMKYPYYSTIPYKNFDYKNILSNGGARGEVIKDCNLQELYIFKLMPQEAIKEIMTSFENEINGIFDEREFCGSIDKSN